MTGNVILVRSFPTMSRMTEKSLVYSFGSLKTGNCCLVGSVPRLMFLKASAEIRFLYLIGWESLKVSSMTGMGFWLAVVS